MGVRGLGLIGVEGFLLGGSRIILGVWGVGLRASDLGFTWNP